MQVGRAQLQNIGHSTTTYQRYKRYKTAAEADRLSDFKLGMGMGVYVIKAEKEWRGVGWPQVAMHSKLARFLVLRYFTESDGFAGRLRHSG